MKEQNDFTDTETVITRLGKWCRQMHLFKDILLLLLEYSSVKYHFAQLTDPCGKRFPAKLDFPSHTDVAQEVLLEL